MVQYKHSYDPPLDLIAPDLPRRRFPYTGLAYALNRDSARILIELIDKYGFIQPADIMRIKLLDLVPGSYTAYPLLVTITLPKNHVAHADDSDIQHDATPVPGAPPYTELPGSQKASKASA